MPRLSTPRQAKQLRRWTPREVVKLQESLLDFAISTNFFEYGTRLEGQPIYAAVTELEKFTNTDNKLRI